MTAAAHRTRANAGDERPAGVRTAATFPRTRVDARHRNRAGRSLPRRRCRLPTEGTSGIIATPLSAFIRAGHSGVTLCFMLSGFLLSLPFLSEVADRKRVRRWDYYRRSS